MEGTIIAGLVVGIVEAFTVQYLGSGVIDLVVFALLLAMLVVKPTGLIAERKEENV
jgi:branched-chain amino acid transport system permease protein